MADRTFNVMTQLSINDADFKAGLNKVKGNVKELIMGAEGATGSLGEMRKALMALKNISFAGKTKEDVAVINTQIGKLMDDMADLKAEQKGLGTEFGSIFANGLQGLAAAGEIVVGVASAFGVSKEKAEQYQKVMVQLIGVSQAFATIQSLLEERTLQIIAMKIEDIAVTTTQTVVTKAAAIAQLAFNSALLVTLATAGLIIAAVAAIAAGIYFLIKAIKNHNEEQKINKALAEQDIKNKERQKKANEDFADSYMTTYAKQKVAIDRYIATASNEQLALSKRQKALEELIKLDPKYLEGLTLQNLKTKEGSDLINAYVEALNKKAQAQAAEEQLVELYKERNKLEVENLKNKKEQETISALKKGVATTEWGAQVKLVEPVAGEEIQKRQSKVNESLATTSSALQNVNNLIAEFNTIASQTIDADFGSKSAEKAKGPYQQLVDKIKNLKDLISDIRAQGGTVTPQMITDLAKFEKQLAAADAQIEKDLKLAAGRVDQKPMVTIKPLSIQSVVSSKTNLPQLAKVDLDKRMQFEKDFTKFQKNQFEERYNSLKSSLDKGEVSYSKYVDGVKLLESEKNLFIFGNLSDTLGSMAGLFKEQSAGYKALSLAQIAISTTVAAIAALQPPPIGYGPALGAWAAAAIIASGVAAAAKVAGIQFAEGGIVPGSNYTGDRVPVMANSGEMILNTTQQKNLFNMLDRNNNNVFGNGREVVFKIEGTQLVGVLNNHSRKINAIR